MVSMYDAALRYRDLRSIDLTRGVSSRLTFDRNSELAAVWSPDGRRIAFGWFRKSGYDLFQKDASGAGTEEPLIEDEASKWPVSWSPDGRFLLFTRTVASPTRSDLWVLPLEGDRKPFAFLATTFNETAARFSPDGRWIAYTSDETGRDEIYVTRFPNPGGKRQVSTGGGVSPRWTREGREIFYSTGSAIMRIPVDGRGDGFEVGTPQQIAQIQMPALVRSTFDVTADGERLLIARMLASDDAPPVTLVVNWLAGVRKP
jgi:Tol biopolymer transport system component